MSWGWVPDPPADAPGGPSRGLRLTVTVLVVVMSAVAGIWGVQVWSAQQRDDCLSSAAPDSVVTVSWQWWPPRYECAEAIPGSAT